VDPGDDADLVDDAVAARGPATARDLTKLEGAGPQDIEFVSATKSQLVYP
jgi:hypothetical protein